MSSETLFVSEIFEKRAKEKNICDANNGKKEADECEGEKE
jgi:hypothetical protein